MDSKLAQRNAFIKAKSLENDEFAYFSQNIFDEGYVDPDAEPDEPVFTADQLEAARKESYDQGKADGLREATERERASRDQLSTQALHKIGSATTELFAQEDHRQRLYQGEAVALSAKIFQRLFPVLDTLLGFETVKSHINDILKKHKKTPTINIYVSPDNVGKIQEFVNTLVTQGHNGVFNIYDDAHLDDTACRLDWPQGGAYFNNAEIAEEIRTILEQTLAAAGISVHDEDEDAATPAEQSDAALARDGDAADAVPEAGDARGDPMGGALGGADIADSGDDVLVEETPNE